MKSCFDGYLTSECKNCEFWCDGSDPNKGIGCGTPYPIDHCEYFNKMSKEEEKKWTGKRIGMKTCNACRFRYVSLIGNKAWKCTQFRNIKRFNIAWLHGWFCKYFVAESEDRS